MWRGERDGHGSQGCLQSWSPGSVVPLQIVLLVLRLGIERTIVPPLGIEKTIVLPVVGQRAVVPAY